MVNGRATGPEKQPELKLDGLLNLRLARQTSRSDNGDHHKKEHCDWL